MGVDISLIFVPQSVPADTIRSAAAKAYRRSKIRKLVAAWGSVGPSSVTRAVPTFTAITLWADSDAPLAPAAIELSRVVGRLVSATQVDHACAGGWECFDRGTGVASNWTEGDDYLSMIHDGIEACCNVRLRAGQGERLLFAESFLPEAASVVKGRVNNANSGQELPSDTIRALFEHDLPDDDLECLLHLGGDD